MKPKIVGWRPSGRKNGPATRAHSTRSAVCEGRRCVRPLWRTGEERRQAPPKMRFLVVVVERNRMVSCAPARPCSESSPQTRIDRLLLSKRLACGCKGIGRGVEAHACQGIDAMAKHDQRAHYCARKPPAHGGQRLRASAAAKLHVDATAQIQLARPRRVRRSHHGPQDRGRERWDTRRIAEMGM